MAQRFGRRRKRALEQRIRDLEALAFGPAGRCPDTVESIDDLPIISKSVRIEDSRRDGYDVRISADIHIGNAAIQDRVLAMVHSEPVRMDGRCLIPVSIGQPEFRGPTSALTLTVNFRQIVPPNSLRARP